jgi:hypothetical protein
MKSAEAQGLCQGFGPHRQIDLFEKGPPCSLKIVHKRIFTISSNLLWDENSDDRLVPFSRAQP